MNDFVIDASVAFKWFILEEDSEQALKLLDQLIFFYAPSIFPLEIDSILTKKVRKRELEIGEALIKREAYKKLPYRLIKYDRIEEFAFRLATEFSITLFDALYLATTVDYEATLYTADKKLFNGLANTPFSEYIKLVGE